MLLSQGQHMRWRTYNQRLSYIKMECASFEHFTSLSLPSISAAGPVITHFWAGYIIIAGMQHSDKYGADQLYETLNRLLASLKQQNGQKCLITIFK